MLWCAAHGVGAFRVNSRILPLVTHPGVGYRLEALDRSGALAQSFREIGALAKAHGIRLSFHPDQFIVLGSVREPVVQASLAELEYQAHVAEWLGAEQLTLHGGGAPDGKAPALERFRRGFARLSERARSRIALENDDRIYTVEDLLPVCRKEGIPLVYDVHHHRCLPDRLSVAEATDASARTWKERTPWAHLSSPRGGYRSRNPLEHSDYIQPAHVPAEWLGRRLTVDIEAKTKELAVLRLKKWLDRSSGPAHETPRRRPPVSQRVASARHHVTDEATTGATPPTGAPPGSGSSSMRMRPARYTVR